MSSNGGALLLYNVLIGLWLVATSSAAQTPEVEAQNDTSSDAGVEPAPAPAILPPRLVLDPGVAYPQRALEERFYVSVDVVLILELDAEGRVTAASVETPRGHGFDEAALHAAGRLRFEPALRRGVAAAARIRYRYAFAPPPAALLGLVSDAASAAPIAGARVVALDSSGTERSVISAADGSWGIPDVPHGVTRLRVDTREHIAQETQVTLIPGNETRVVFQLQPRSLASASSAEPVLEVTVRGERLAPMVSSYARAEVRQIPGAFGDPFRAIETLPGVTPLASGLPYSYVRGAPPGNVGYFLDGVRVPYLYHIGAGPSVVQPAIVERVDLYPGGYPARFGRFAGGIVSATTTDPRPELHGEGNLRLFDVGGLVETGFAGGRGTLLLGGRYSYTATLLSLAAPKLKLDYRDFQARGSYDLTANDRLSVFSFGSYDLLEEDGELRFGSEFYRGDLRYDHAFDAGKLRTALTLGYDRTNARLVSDDGDLRIAADRSIALRSELTHTLGARVVLHGGGDIGLDRYDLEGASYSDPDSPEAQEFNEQFPARSELAAGAWLDLVVDATPAIQLTPGVRCDVYRARGETPISVDARLAGRFALAPMARIISALGLVHQPPSFLVPLPAITPANGHGLQRSLQSSAGVEADLDEATLARTSVFYNAFFAMTDALGTYSGEGNPDLEQRSRGESYGVEVFLRRRLTKRVGGFVSYTFSRSFRRVRGEEFPSALDRPHVANAALSLALGRGWSSGARFTYYSGTPPPREADEGEQPPSTKREPAFHRLDLRLEKRWALGSDSWMAFVIEFMNATLRKETWPGGETIGPIAIPSLGLEVGF
jgi:TonB family protein